VVIFSIFFLTKTAHSLRYVRIFVGKNSGKRNRQKVRIFLSHYLYRLNVVGKQSVFGRKIVKFIPIKTAQTTTLRTKPNISATVLVCSIDLRLRQALRNTVFDEIILLPKARNSKAQIDE